MTWKHVGGVRKSFSQRVLQKNSVAPIANRASTSQTTSSQNTTVDPSLKEPSTSSIPGSSRISEVAPGKSYELSAAQFRHLNISANMEGMVMMVGSPNFHDTPERARELQQSCAEYDDLLALQLVDDVSANYEDNVREAWEEKGRHIRFLFISNYGQLMFARYEGDEERKPN